MATKMKPSGIEWIGEIPKGWEIKKITHLFNIIGSGTTPLSSNPDYYNGEINWVNTGDLNDGVLYSTERKITEVALADYSTLKQFKEGSLIIAMYGATIGKVSILEIKAATNQACCVLSDPVGVITKYVYYWFISNRDNVISLALGGGQPNISQDLIRSLRIPIPGEKEQRAIVNYLDQKCGDIDKVISAKQRQNELLKEHRQSIIYEAVTKGLNKNVKYKDSGIEWIGEIPEDWDISKVKHFYETQLGKMLQPSQKNDNETLEKYLCSFNITWDGINQREIKEMWFNEREKKTFSIKWGDLLVSEGGDAGRACICDIDFPCYIQNAVHRVRARENAINKYLYYWLYVLKAIGYIDLLCNKATIMHFTQDKMLNIDIPIPPLDVQQHIADYLDQKCAEIDRIINANNDMIEKLKEYRQSIVYEAVTGKINI